jgi:eukaryotic-like serine/threonine-protein kinase
MMGNVTKPETDREDEDGITIDVDMPAKAPAQVAIGVGAMLLGRYRIESRLGVGGLGSVYKAVDRVRSEHAHIDGRVALKIVHAGPDTPASDLDKLRHEFYCAQKLAHPSIVKVFELEGSDDLAFFTMEFLDGEPLGELMKRSQSKGLPRPQAWNIIREIGDGLAHAHSRGVVHGDLQPQNVIILKAGGLRMLDFGAATVGDGTAAMTLAYASCQLLEGAEPEQRDDIFALACVAYELLTGAHPFQSRSAKEARAAGMKANEPKNLSAGQWQALQRGLAWESEDRPNSMQEWLTELVLSAAPRGKRSRDEDKVDAGSRIPGSRQPGFGFTRWALALAVPLALASGWALVHSMSDKPAIVAVAATANAPELTPIPLPSEQDLKEREAKMLGVDDVAPTPAPPPPKPKRVAKAATGPVVEKIAFSEGALNLEPGAKFAEIHVTRSEARGEKTSFVWWTEPGSAAADADFVAQQHTTAYFPARNHMTTLFVKLVPNAKRKKSQVFYLNIAEASDGAAIGTTSRAAITLLPRGA